MKNAILRDVSHYVKLICSLKDKCICNALNKNEILLFRGQPDKDYPLLPSIGRNREDIFDISILDEERNLIEMAKFKLPSLFRNDLQPIELLAMLQHHGIPTRLLDVTENALVALYFACCEDNEHDGEVIIFKNNERDVTNYPVIQAIADTYRIYRQTTIYSLSLFYEAASSLSYFQEFNNLKKTIKSPSEGGQWIGNCCKKIMFIYAPNLSLRQQVQSGRYILFPNQISKNNFEKNIDAIKKNNENIVGRFFIPKQNKQNILDQLNILGINKEALFCDNIDIVCSGIKNKFNEKTNKALQDELYLF